MTPVLLDDHLLRDVLTGTDNELLWAQIENRPLQTTNMYYYRLCRSATAATGGQLTGGWSPEQRRALGRVLTSLPDQISIVPMRNVARRMAELARHHALSTLGAETVAAAATTDATIIVWAGDDSPRIRGACGEGGIDYLTVEL